MSVNHTFAARLQAVVETSGYTPEEIAKKAGVSLLTLQHYLRGRRIPNMKNLSKLSKALKDVDTGWLVNGGKQ
jgi:transcriptional regulator with XRE-family HTH domain